MLVVAIILQPDHPENDELNEWAIFAQDLLKVFRPHNGLAVQALQHMSDVRRRSDFVRCISRDPTIGQTCAYASGDVTMSVMQRMERAVKILAQPASSLADRLGHDALADNVWDTQRFTAYAARFPGVESLSKPVGDLENFFDNCTSIHSQPPLSLLPME